MNFEILHKLPKYLFIDLPLEVQLYLDCYISDRQSMLLLSKDFIDSKVLPRTYNSILYNMKDRTKTSLQELKTCVENHLPDFNLKQLLSDIFIYINNNRGIYGLS